MKKLLLGFMLLLSIITYSKNSSQMIIADKIWDGNENWNGNGNENENCNGNGNENGNNYDDDNEDDDDDCPSAPISDYIYILGFLGIIYVGKKIILKKD